MPKRPSFLPAALAALVLFTARSPAASATAPAERPNILIFIADDLGWGDVGFHGAPWRTPHLDQLAREGVELEQFYVFPVCSPTRAALYTGRSPQRMGIQAPLSTRSAGPPAAEHLMPESFRAAGYQTHLVGKWHLGGGAPERLPHRRGFDSFYGHVGGGVDYFTHQGIGNSVPDWWRNDTAVTEEGYSTDLIADEAARLIQRRDATRPFLMSVAFNAPHTPLQAPAEAIARQTGDPRVTTYAAMVELLDAGIGCVLAALDRAGQRDRTIVMFLSDNGAAGNGSGRNQPWSSAKGSTYEGGIHIPALLRWPGHLVAGTSNAQVMSVMDVFPTFAAAAGVRTLNTLPFDGENLWPALRSGKPAARGPFIIGAMGNLAVREGSWKLVEARGRTNLFDLATDPAEARNLAGEQPEVFARLVTRAKEFTRQMPPAITAGPGGGRPGATGGARHAAPWRARSISTTTARSTWTSCAPRRSRCGNWTPTRMAVSPGRNGRPHPAAQPTRQPARRRPPPLPESARRRPRSRRAIIALRVTGDVVEMS